MKKIVECCDNCDKMFTPDNNLGLLTPGTWIVMKAENFKVLWTNKGSTRNNLHRLPDSLMFCSTQCLSFYFTNKVIGPSLDKP